MLSTEKVCYVKSKTIPPLFSYLNFPARAKPRDGPYEKTTLCFLRIATKVIKEFHLNTKI